MHHGLHTHPSVTELMGKGILAVGFPDNSFIQSNVQLRESVVTDQKKLRQLIYSHDEKVTIPQIEGIFPRYPQAEIKWFKLCCSIL